MGQDQPAPERPWGGALAGRPGHGRSDDRRAFIRLALIGAAAALTMAHTPYRQWQVYRQKHLLIGTHKADPASHPLGQEIAAALAARLPESRARVTRGPDAVRLASLLTTGQLDVVLLSVAEVEALAAGEVPFTGYGAPKLRTLARIDHHHLVVRPDFPLHHAWQVARALPPSLEPVGIPAAPLHPGVTLFFAGGAMPEPPAERPIPIDHRH